MTVDEALKLGAVRLRKAETVFQTVEEFKDQLTTNASPYLWKTYLSINPTLMVETQEIQDTLVTEETPEEIPAEA